jgi:ABC-2 type transport system ATP-binding protein
VLVSTHYMEEATYCDRLALMNRGRLIALDSPAALIRSMEEPILELRGVEPLVALQRLQDVAGVDEAALHGRSVRLVVSEAALEATVRASIERAFPAAGIVRVAPSLEDVFTRRVRLQGGAVVG